MNTTITKTAYFQKCVTIQICRILLITKPFPGGKVARAWSQYLHLVLRSKMHGAILPLHQYAFMAWYLVQAQGHFFCIQY